MPNTIIRERLELILESIDIIEKRISNITRATDLLKDNLLVDSLEKTDYEIIFDICKKHLPDLQQKINRIIES